MFDDFRRDADQAELEEAFKEEVPFRRKPRRPRRLLGMTGFQRFVIMLMLFGMTCLLGVFCLLVTQKVVPIF